MRRNKKKGVVLIVVIMVMAVLAILGTSILQIATSEAYQASNEEKRIQAQYLARAGAEAVVAAWSNASSTSTVASNPSGTSSRVYLDSGNNFVTGSVSNYIGSFEVTVTHPSSNTVVVSSVGTVGPAGAANSVSQTVTATIGITSHTTQVSTGGTEMASKGWYSNNGQVTLSNPTAYDAIDAVIDPPSGNGILKFEHTDSVFRAHSIDFKVGIWNFRNDLVLKSDKIIFEQLINFSHGGSITLRVNPGQTRPGHGSQLYGKIEYNGIWYWFLDGTTLTNPLAQLTDPITVGSPDIPASTASVTTYDYTMKWD